MTIEQFAQLLQDSQTEGARRRYPNDPHMYENVRTRVIRGPKYAKVDLTTYGENHWSGLYMVEIATGDIFGIKGYGVIHRGHRYGNLDTVANWNWTGYKGRKIA